MNEITDTALEQIVGKRDQNTYAAIRATGASLKDVIEAKAIVDGKSDTVGQGEQAIPGPVKDVMTILRAMG